MDGSDAEDTPEEKADSRTAAPAPRASEEDPRSDPPRTLSAKSELVGICLSSPPRPPPHPPPVLQRLYSCLTCGLDGNLHRAICCAGGRCSTNGCRQLASSCALLLTLVTCGWTETGEWTLGSGSALGCGLHVCLGI
eukprot:COSAG02_NODE_11517_length_1707_cov_221.003109_2_plen_137_part_00